MANQEPVTSPLLCQHCKKPSKEVIERAEKLIDQTLAPSAKDYVCQCEQK